MNEDPDLILSQGSESAWLVYVGWFGQFVSWLVDLLIHWLKFNGTSAFYKNIGYKFPIHTDSGCVFTYPADLNGHSEPIKCKQNRFLGENKPASVIGYF